MSSSGSPSGKPFYPGKMPGPGYRIAVQQINCTKRIEQYPDIFRLEESCSLPTTDTDALRFRLNSHIGPMHRTGRFPQPQVPCIWLALPESIDWTQFTHLRFRGRIQGHRAGYVNLGLVNLPISWGDATAEERKKLTGVAIHVPLEKHWGGYVLPLTSRGIEVLKKVRYLQIRTHLSGHHPDEPALAEIQLADFTLTRESVRKSTGWAIDPTIIAVPQTGYRPYQTKHALLNGKIQAKTFLVRNLATGKVAYQGEPRLVTSAIGETQLLDFTPLSQPGQYVLEAGSCRSLPFRIADDAYHECICLLSDWIYNMRCGCETAYHPPCHLDDAWFYPESPGDDPIQGDPIHVDISGGWHDAGDQRSYFNYSGSMPGSAMAIWDAGWRRDRDHDGCDDSVDKALWGLKHNLKIRNPRTGQLFLAIVHDDDMRSGCYWSDNIPGNDDDRRVREHSWVVNQFAMACCSAGRFVERFGPDYPELTKELLKVYRARWDYWFDPQTGALQKMPAYDHWQKPLRGHLIRNVAFYGQAALALYEATDRTEKTYIDFARFCAEKLLDVQRKAFYPDRPFCGDIFSYARETGYRYQPHEFLADLLLSLPNHPDAPRWRAALVRASRWWMKPTRKAFAPFALPTLEMGPRLFNRHCLGVQLQTRPDRWLVPYASGEMIGDTAYAMARVAQALDDPELLNLARRQVLWAVGYNPFGVSFICGFGEDCIDQFYSFTQGRMIGCVGTSLGMGKYVPVPRNHYGIPGVNRPEGPEPWVKVGERLLRAMVACTEPMQLKVTVHQGGTPLDEPVELYWPAGEKTIATLTPDADGKIEIALDGGQKYQLRVNGHALPVTAISGTQRELRVDMDRLVLMTASAPDTITAGQPENVTIRLNNLSSNDVSIVLSLHAENATPASQSTTLSLGAGENRTLDIPLTATQSGQPWIVLIQGEGTCPSRFDLTGTVLEK